MIVRAGTGWQYALADLSLILFLATASALSQAGDKAHQSAAAVLPVAAVSESEPVAVWSAGSNAPPLDTWLGQVAKDPRLEVRIVIRYTGDSRSAAMAQAAQLAESGGPRASQARIFVEPGQRAGASVTLVYTSEVLARRRTDDAARPVIQSGT